ncbi:Dual specificity tyrosine-phosphorylation-regulated kinase 1A [Trichinella pseudospiralis]
MKEAMAALHHHAELNQAEYENGLLRVGGRLRLSDLDYEMKYPIILPKKHHIIINGRAAVKRVLSYCVICKRQERWRAYRKCERQKHSRLKTPDWTLSGRCT